MPAVVWARSRALCGLVAALLCFACSEPTSSSEAVPLEGLVVSDAVMANGMTAISAAAASRPSLDLTTVDPTAYVSLAPGSVPAGTVATIHDVRNGQSISVPLVGGGFDPVGIVAAAGDTLDITITLSTGGLSLAMAVVPVHRPPRVVRTDPPRDRTDVAINATIVVIFSEPINSATLDTGTVRLLQGGVPVPGNVRSLAGATSAEFVPATSLTPATAYELVLGSRIEDLSGDQLEPVRVTFATARGAASNVPYLAFAVQPENVQALARFAVAPQVLAYDATGNVDHGFTGPVTVTLTANPGGAVLAGSTTVTAVAGVATFPDLSVAAAGTRDYLIAQAAGFAQGYSTAFDVAGVANPPEQPSSWTVRTPAPMYRDLAATAVVDGILYVIGGEDGVTGVVGTVEAYDPATDSWRTMAPMHVPREGLALGVVNGIIYALGGANNGIGWSTLRVVEAYDPATNIWSVRSAMPTAREGLGVGVIGGTLYAVGGREGSYGNIRTVGTVEAYDPVQDIWVSRAAMPTARAHLGVAVVNGQIYAAGGLQSTDQPDALRTMEIYDPGRNTWTVGAPMAVARRSPAIGVVTNLLYAVGGFSVDGALASSEVYDVATGGWQAGPPLPHGEGWWNGTAVVNGVLYAVTVGGMLAYRP